MRVLLDECLPRRRARDLIGHDVTTVPEMSRAGTKNGDLLRLAATRFDAFVTIDQGLTFQQHLATALGGSRLGGVVLHTVSNRLAALRPRVPTRLGASSSLRPGEARHVSRWIDSTNSAPRHATRLPAVAPRTTSRFPAWRKCARSTIWVCRTNGWDATERDRV
jgi:PIN like domain